MNGAFESVHHGSNNVHADTAARNFRDFCGGTEAGLENQVERVLVAHAFGFLRLNYSFLDRVSANQREIDSAAVITDFDHHLRALMIGVQIDGTARGLSSSEALFGSAHPVIHGVSNQVHQRLGEGIQNAFVEVGVLSGNFQRNVFPSLLADVANNPRKTAEELFDRYHGNFQHAFVELIKNA